MQWRNKLARFLAARPVQILARLLLGGIFIYASLDKISHPREFAAIVANYGILPDFLLSLLALVLPWLELIAGLCLVCGLWVRSAAFLLSLLLLAFILALGFNAARGVSLSCGCFSSTAADSENIYMLIFRDLLFLIPGLLIIFFNRGKKDS